MLEKEIIQYIFNILHSKGKLFKRQDEKLIGVPLSDPRWENVHSLKDVNPHTLREIKHFFERYKELENKETTIIGWEGRDVALKLIKSCQDRFKKYPVAE
ncbi:inorganic pyrophosphatase family protein [Anoxybacillus sp. B7M1]|uniref:inorganic diphosphatase n=1 Tax=unclassified Anoxybacillus TaxID=2639704 RepID=UPI0007B58330|nr:MULTISPECIES: inorganic diphosphatase [unclassified Anoxybacillus]ANB58949.1 inorganic pyrophosphatase family protein [Anoxybacillus sp. B2M1]ANB65793.1 inorganic pyrophosphatase family protein [Anoxybacillus sp. B7M1]